MATTWTKTGKDSWRAECNGRTLVVRRKVVKRSRTYAPRFITIGRKPRHTTTTTLAYAFVRLDGVSTELETSFSVRAAMAAAERFAAAGEGKVKATISVGTE